MGFVSVIVSFLILVVGGWFVYRANLKGFSADTLKAVLEAPLGILRKESSTLPRPVIQINLNEGNQAGVLNPPPKINSVLATGSTVELEVPDKKLAVGQTIKVAVKVSSAKNLSYGAIALVKFDPRFINLTADLDSSIVKGNVFDTMTFSAESEDTIRLAGLVGTSPESAKPKEVAGVLGYVNFKTVKPGVTTIKLLPSSEKDQTSSSVILGVDKYLIPTTKDLTLTIN